MKSMHWLSACLWNFANGDSSGGRIRDLDLLDSWIQQILHALCRLHKNGIVHRNLALKNILLDPANRIKLSDYGLFHITGYGADVSFPVG